MTTGNPFVLNQRLSIQQGIFLLPGDVSQPWIDNLRAIKWSESLNQSRAFVIESADIREVFELLLRTNVTTRSLFPGIDGYAKSLWHRLRLLKDLEVPEGSI